MSDEEQRKQLQLAAQLSTRSKLMMWFSLNRAEVNNHQLDYRPGTAAEDLLFLEIPRYYRWDTKNRAWVCYAHLSKAFQTVARIYTVHVKDKERYFPRMLLYHVRGATSYADVRTVDDTTYDTYREACLARNLLADDKEWSHCMRENVGHQMPSALRKLLMHIFIECDPSDKALSDEFADQISEDYLHKARMQTQSDTLSDTQRQHCHFAVLLSISAKMQDTGKYLDETLFTAEYVSWLTSKNQDDRYKLANRLVDIELHYDAGRECCRGSSVIQP